MPGASVLVGNMPGCLPAAGVAGVVAGIVASSIAAGVAAGIAQAYIVVVAQRRGREKRQREKFIAHSMIPSIFLCAGKARAINSPWLFVRACTPAFCGR